MKKLLLTIIVLSFALIGYSQTTDQEVWKDGQAPATIRNAVNTKFDYLTDTTKVTLDTIRMHSDSIDIHRGLIDLNFGWIYDIMNDSLPDHWDVINAIKYDSLPAIRADIGTGGGGTTPVSDFLFWNTDHYEPYAGTTEATAGGSTSGRFYKGNSFILAATDDRLNYTGGLYSNTTSIAAIRGESNNYVGVYGATNAEDPYPGVYGIATGGHTYQTGVKGSASPLGTGGSFSSSGGVGLSASSGTGTAAILHTTTNTSSTSNVVEINRLGGGTSIDVTGNLLYIEEKSTTTGTISGNIIQADWGGSTVFTVENDGSVNIPTGSEYKINGVSITAGGGAAASFDSTYMDARITALEEAIADTVSFDTTSVTTDFLMRDDPFSAPFGLGANTAYDTALFSADVICGWFIPTDTIVIDSVYAVALGTSPSITFDICFDEELNATTPTKATSSAIAVTGTQATTTTFANTEVPAGQWVYFKLVGVTTKPTMFAGNLIYHYK